MTPQEQRRADREQALDAAIRAKAAADIATWRPMTSEQAARIRVLLFGSQAVRLGRVS